MDRIIDKSQIRRESTRRIIIGCGIALIAIIAISSIIMAMSKSVHERDLRIANVEMGPLETTVSGSGRFVPAFEEIINSPVETRIMKVFVHPGDSVKEGTPLLQIDLEASETAYNKLLDEHRIKQQELTQLKLGNDTKLSELAMQIKVKEMTVNRLRVEVDNERRLDSLGSGTGDRVRQAETAYLAATLELKQMREQLVNERLRSSASEKVQALSVSIFEKDLELMKRTLDRGRIPAPHDGVVTYLSTEIGSRIAMGEKVAVVSDLSQFKIEGEVPEGSSDRVGVGSSVKARIGNSEFTGTVTNITPQAKSGVVTFSVMLDDSRNKRLRSGLRTELYISYGYKDRVLRMPSGRYFKGPGEYALFVMDGDDRLVKRKVQLGDSNREYVEILSGLQTGDRVVISDMDEYNKSDKLKINKD